MLQITDVAYRYPRDKSDFTFTCDSVEFVPARITCVLGANGSGKSTLFKIACGIIAPDGAKVVIDGQDMTGLTLAQFGKRVGYLFQEPSHQLFATSVFEELTFIADLLGTDADKQEAKQKAVGLLKRFNLWHLKDRGVFRLSRGEKQRLAICAVLMQEPGYLLFDEPTTGLDLANREILKDHLIQLASVGVSVNVITHDHELASIAERVIELHEGTVLHEV